ncbi:MAG: aminotransferase [Azospirillum sp.]|nr:aminotransferase [Azospirillum sp.]MCA3265169.1 aminotransferase [Azospirillum sp.]MCZ8122477.1 aminotransferase [Magnetospirillum sp.]
MNPIFAELPTTIFEEMSALARALDAVNLGQGFPDDPGPEDVRRKAADAVISGWNQYPPMPGLPELRQAVAAHYKVHQGLEIDPMAEVMVTSGATEAIAGALLALIAPGDEVVLFEPYYDAYLPLVRRAGGVPKFVKLAPPDWRFTKAQLAAAIGPKTRVVLFNNPLNPSATVYGPAELRLIAEAIRDTNAIVVADEVWEHVIFDGRAHTSVLAIPELRARSVKIGSAGKIFSLTGWKVGFTVAAPDILKVLMKAHQFLTFTTPPNLQSAVAYGLGKDAAHFDAMRADLTARRDHLAKGLASAGFKTLACEGTYFINVDLAPLGLTDDQAFCRRLVKEAGVAAIPVSAFYADGGMRSAIRFCFAKKYETLDAAVERLARYAPKLAA